MREGAIFCSHLVQEEEVNFCWKQWASDSLTKKGKIEIEDFKKLFNIAEADDKEAKKLFKVLDFDDDDKIEFPELMLYIYSTEENLSRQQKLQRSYNFYDNNGSGKISQACLFRNASKSLCLKFLSFLRKMHYIFGAGHHQINTHGLFS